MRQNVLMAVACIMLVLSAFGQDEPKPTVSNDPLTDDQIAIYRTVLNDFVPGRGLSAQLADVTAPLVISKRAQCANTPPANDVKPVVHRLTAAVVTGKDLPLVEPWQPPMMRHGPPNPNVPKLGMLTLSEIAFDGEHLSATVTYDFVCGGLCGHGKAMELKKVSGEWRIDKICLRWMY